MIQYNYFQDIPDLDANKQAKKKTFVCKNCHSVIVSPTQPSDSNCPSSTRKHIWYTYATIGTKPKWFVCRNCGLRIFSSLSPSSWNTCMNGNKHIFSSM